jgi:hypothetical protein
LKVNGTYQLLVYGAVNVLGRSLLTMKKNKQTLVVVSQDIGLEVNADETKYMAISRDLNAGRIDNSSFERVKEFRYLGTTLTNLKILFRKKLRTD